ncbi:MAG: hypothetical protein JWM68_3807 [Verrucomicrobiales bacterium]|nr:hypothetical protein [Verrucomicrobiales bacterium]
MGESVELTLKFEDADPRQQPTLPAINGLKVVGQRQAQNFSSINGEVHREYSFTYTLVPTKEGDVSLPGMQLEVNGQKLTSAPLKLKVVKSVNPPVAGAAAVQPAILQLIVPKNEIYVGEVFPAELRLYFRDLGNISLPQILGEGFTMGALPQNPDRGTTVLNGERFNYLSFRFPVTAVKPGELKLGPASCAIAIVTRYGRNLFGENVAAETRPVTVTNEAQTMIVHALPKENIPPTFNGAIGQFNLHVEAGPTNVAVGDPVTVKVQISGRGALDALSLPTQPGWREFKSYAPSSKVDLSDRLGVEGTKTFEQVVAPQNADVKELPQFDFSFFDTEQKTYRTISTPAIPLSVRPTSATPQPTVVSAGTPGAENQTSLKEIGHIKPQLGALQSAQPPLIRQPGFLILQAFAPALWLGSIFLRRSKDKLANNPKLRRRRAVDRIVAEGLQQLSAQAAANKSDDFFATTFRLLQERLGEQVDLPASAITEAVVDERLKPAGVAAETITLLHELFQTCNQARYAPVRSPQKLAAYIPKVETALTNLQKHG